jgi:hypothetical protein
MYMSVKFLICMGTSAEPATRAKELEPLTGAHAG